ncbi:MAG TPA: hypothetical protein VL027_13825 [Spongiibacteraceae bacterium]|nr:hypothetical protein [Spongiibacteraceae bacterium]
MRLIFFRLSRQNEGWRWEREHLRLQNLVQHRLASFANPFGLPGEPGGSPHLR